MNNLTKSRRDELARLAEAATPGPWAKGADGTSVILDYRNDDGALRAMNYHRNGCAKVVATVRYADWRNCFADAAFIAASSPTTIKALLAELDAKDAEIERLRGQVDMRNDSILDHLDRIQFMRPVVEAAVMAERLDRTGECNTAYVALMGLWNTVRAYEANMKEVGDVEKP